VHDGKDMVLKRTVADLCDMNALSLLINTVANPLGGWSDVARAQVGAPRAAWIENDFLWELQDYYDGISLGSLILRNNQSMHGTFLKHCADLLFNILFALGKVGLIHRDISPFNLFLTYSGKLLLIDWTFCMQLSTKSRPVRTPGYTAPEQERGNPCHASDWYSSAATLFFLGNCEVPPDRGGPKYESGMEYLYTPSYRLDYQVEGGYYESSGLPTLCDELLTPDPNCRPIPSTIHWIPISGESLLFEDPRVFDFGPSNHLLVTTDGFLALPAQCDLFSSWLASMTKEGIIAPPPVKKLARLYGRKT
jgi:serine/threonine protein kinase